VGAFVVLLCYAGMYDMRAALLVTRQEVGFLAVVSIHTQKYGYPSRYLFFFSFLAGNTSGWIALCSAI
jgi:hypothetical protein